MKTEKPLKPFKTTNIGLSDNEKMTLVSNLHTMLAAGIPILETVDSLLEDSKGNQKKLLLAMKEDLGQGQHVYYTFSRFPKIFNKVTVNILKASEEAGTLDVTLKDLKENIKKDSEFTDKIKSALIYPVFILVVFLCVMLVILIVVVPKISSVFSKMDVVMPLPTQIMIVMSDILLHQTLYVIAGIALVVFTIIFLLKQYKRAFINVLLSVPIISSLAMQIDLTRFTRSLYLLLNAGLPITSALELTQDVVIKNDIKKAIKHSKDFVISGKKMSDGLKDSRKVIPGIMIKIVEAGERSGTLDKSMQDASEYLDYQVSKTLKTLITLIEPLMLVVVGVLIGGMMMAIIAPMYQLIGQVGAH